MQRSGSAQAGGASSAIPLDIVLKHILEPHRRIFRNPIGLCLSIIFEYEWEQAGGASSADADAAEPMKIMPRSPRQRYDILIIY